MDRCPALELGSGSRQRQPRQMGKAQRDGLGGHYRSRAVPWENLESRPSSGSEPMLTVNCGAGLLSDQLPRGGLGSLRAAQA